MCLGIPGQVQELDEGFGNQLALNCWVIKPGSLRLGAPAEIVNNTSTPAHLGGWIAGAPYLT